MHDLAESNNWITTLPEPLKTEVLGRARTVKYAFGKPVYMIGEGAGATFQLQSGEVGIYTYSNEGDEVLISTMGPGDCFGLMSMLDGLRRGNTAIAIDDCEVLLWEKAVFDDLYQQHSEVARNLCRLFSRRTRYLMSMLNETTTLKLRQRIGRLLCRLVPFRGKLEGGSAVLSGVTHDMIASAVGSSRQSVGREIRELEKGELISLHYKKIIIHDFRRFQDIFYTLLWEDKKVVSQ